MKLVDYKHVHVVIITVYYVCVLIYALDISHITCGDVRRCKTLLARMDRSTGYTQEHIIV